MSNSSVFPKTTTRSSTTKWRLKRYLLIWGMLNASIWGGSLLYLKLKPPIYSSQWAISVNGGRLNTNVDLPGIGQATSSSESSYNSQSSDPRENYKFLLNTPEVLETAAAQVDLPASQFGQLKAKILNNTTLLQLEIQAESPQLAQEKAVALQKVLEIRLDELRLAESAEYNRNMHPALEPLRGKLQVAQKRLYDYKSRSLLSSTEQLKSASENLEALRRSFAEAAAELARMRSRVEQLASSLGLSVSEASDALVLQSNQVFQQYLTEYSKSATELTRLNTRFTSTSPPIIAKQKTNDELYAKLARHSQILLSRSISPVVLERLSLSNSSSEQANLFQQLVLLQEQYRGLQAHVTALNQQITQLESRKKVLTQEESKLDSLERDVKIADALYSSNLTKLDLSKLINSPSYPPIAVITQPSLDTKPTAPKKKLVLLGTALASLFITTGIITLWLRDRKFSRGN